MNKKTFNCEIKKMQLGLKFNLEKETFRLYWERLKWIENNDFQRICENLLDSWEEKRFPNIAHFIQEHEVVVTPIEKLKRKMKVEMISLQERNN